MTTRRAVLAALLLGGCNLQIPGQGPGPRQFRLTPKTTFPADLPKVGWALAVAEPVADRTIDTARIAIIESGLNVEYYADATWVDRAPTLIQGLIVQSFVNSGAITTVGTDRDRLRADFLLRPTLRAFYTLGAGGPARVVLDLALVTLPGRDVVGTTTVTAEAPPASRSLDAVVAAFDEALGRAFKDTVLWTLRTGQAAPPVG
jgi:cholesterol transport system auxiliary component